MESQYLLEAILKREGVPTFSEYPFNLNAVRNLQRLRFHPAMTYVVGENGSGKSTLLEAIAVALGFNPEGGTRNFGFSTRQSHSKLWEHIRLAKGIRRPMDGFFLRAESFFNVATNIEALDREPAPAPPIINSYGGVSLHEHSQFRILSPRTHDRGVEQQSVLPLGTPTPVLQFWRYGRARPMLSV